MPLIQANTELYTFADAVNYVLDSHEITRNGLNLRRARAAVLKAYRDIANKHEWSYYYRQRLIQTVASYSTGTVVYDHTGGAHERLLTLTTGTWPSWASFGRVIIDSVHYEVEDRKSDSLLTLRSDSNPGADVASTTYEIYRSAYPLPANFHRLTRLWDVEQNRQVSMVSEPMHHAAVNVWNQNPETPFLATLRGDPRHYGAMSIVFGPPPNAVQTYDLLYQVSPRRLDPNNEYSSGSVACPATTAVTGTSTTFPTNCVGSIIRFSGNTTPPTGIIGHGDLDNPFTDQGVIKTRTSATALVLEEALGSTVSGVGFTISDPLDIEPGAMLSAFLKAAEAEFAGKSGRKDAALKLQEARSELILAMESDNRVENVGGTTRYDPMRMGEALDADQ